MNKDAQMLLAFGIAMFLLCVGIGSCVRLSDTPRTEAIKCETK